MILYLIIIVLSVAADQFSKYLAVEHLAGNPSYPFIENILHFTYVENRGAAFGMLSNHRWIFMIISSAAIICAFIWLIWDNRNSANIKKNASNCKIASSCENAGSRENASNFEIANNCCECINNSDEIGAKWLRCAVALIIGGGIGNMIDRVLLGYVVDFIDVVCIDFYVFNIADSCVCVGCAIFFLCVVLSEIKTAREKKLKSASSASEDEK